MLREPNDTEARVPEDHIVGSAPTIRGVVSTVAGTALIVLTTWVIFNWTPIEVTQGIIQRIYYVHVPLAWIAEASFVATALLGTAYLWLHDDRVDAAAAVSAEGGLFMAVGLLIVGPLWARVAWGAYWSWDPRLTFTALLFFIFVGYFMVRGAAADPDSGKRYSAVVAIVGALDIPMIHMSVYWFRSLHPEPVVLRPEGPNADPRIVITLLLAVAAYSVTYAGLWWLRYLAELANRGLPLASREPTTGVAP
jgi:heme exporter protein C